MIAKEHSREYSNGFNSPDRHGVDMVARAIVTASILLFVGSGYAVWPDIVKLVEGRGNGPDAAAGSLLLLNVAIAVFAWSHYRQLHRQLRSRVAAEREARQLAETDALTGFLNRRSFDRVVDAMITGAAGSEHAIAALMIDLDNFKQVNDYNGHSVGDLLLLEFAKRITATMPAGAAIGRVGGDEFAAAFTYEKNRPEQVMDLAEQLLSQVSQASRVNEISIEVTASVGVARSDMQDFGTIATADARGLLEIADVAMYQAKREGRNRAFAFEAAMAEEMRHRRDLERGIRDGIPRGEFIPYYERQVDLQTGELTGFEMLARWNSPQFGLVPPDVFIPIAEEIGAIAELSQSLITQALQDARNWDAKLSLAVNISPIQLRDPWFAQRLVKMLVEANFPPHRLEVEITESCLHQNLAQVRALITSLKNMGVRISLDDFGTGYSSLAQLRSLPFDRIKIDRSFVSNLIENRDSAAIVHAIAMLGQGMNLPITAEGIENDEVLERLRHYGEIQGQGYLYGMPQPAGSTLEWLETMGLALERISPAVAEILDQATIPDESPRAAQG